MHDDGATSFPAQLGCQCDQSCGVVLTHFYISLESRNAYTTLQGQGRDMLSKREALRCYWYGPLIEVMTSSLLLYDSITQMLAIIICGLHVYNQ